MDCPLSIVRLCRHMQSPWATTFTDDLKLDLHIEE